MKTVLIFDPKIELPKEFRTQWLADLRSGNYAQSKEGKLVHIHEDASIGYCCLEVAGSQNFNTDDMAGESWLNFENDTRL